MAEHRAIFYLLEFSQMINIFCVCIPLGSFISVDSSIWRRLFLCTFCIIILYCIEFRLPAACYWFSTEISTRNLNGTLEDEETLKDLEKRSTRLRARTFVFCSLFLTRLQADYQVRPEF